MSEGMAEVIAAHWAAEIQGQGHPMYLRCAAPDCLWEGPYFYTDHSQHVAEELAKAGYGDVRKALRTTADEMQAERETWCLDESGRHWIKRTLDDLRQHADALEASHGVD